MIKGFVARACYEHSGPSSLYIKVLKIRHVSPERVKLQVQFYHKHNDRIQYTGKGSTGHTDEIRIMKEDFQYWTLRPLEDRKIDQPN